MNTSLLVGFAIVIGAPAKKEAPAKEPPSLVGEWVGESAVRGGKPDNPPAGTTITFAADGKVFMKEGGDAKAEEGTYKVDIKKMPAELDLVPSLADKAPTLVAIYKIEGDTLTIALTLGGERPKEFASPPGSQVMLVTCKRAKK